MVESGIEDEVSVSLLHLQKPLEKLILIVLKRATIIINLEICICPRYYEGPLCDLKKCLYGLRIKDVTGKSICRCSDPHIEGTFCELINCEFGGKPENGSCLCFPMFRTGRFCEKYTVTFYIASAALFIFGLLVLCYMIISPTWIERQVEEDALRRISIGTYFRFLQFLLGLEVPSGASLDHRFQNERIEGCRGSTVEQCVEMISRMDPRVLAAVGEHWQKYLDPPPPYEQAIVSCPTQPPSSRAGGSPPPYTSSNEQNSHDAESRVEQQHITDLTSNREDLSQGGETNC
ncbi:unnamed protein product [Enterobius vermicularis]|uniref:EGF-like domain-containing protein n=1 Tax=Enterobius vermicularis TaxID=51028 RepID=A0A0N4VKC2_ENTVE|nr:unnamed protein product [Enterobius vermicularis]